MKIRSDKMEKELIKEAVGNMVELGDTFFKSIVPEDAKKHFHSACRETLLGMIAILDYADKKDAAHTSKEPEKAVSAIHSINITE
jgi:hypothetical protein